jgi:hypothetical protein
MPCHADWLNDLSLMPPVSVTMHPRKLPVVDPVAVLLDPAAGLDEPVAGVLVVLLAVDVLLPHAAMSRVAAPAAIVAANEVCFIRSSTGPVADTRTWGDFPVHRLLGD